jgi:hypothetical protein
MLAGPVVELSDVRSIEIRSKLAGLPADKRFAAISRAIARGDDSVVASLLGSDRPSRAAHPFQNPAGDGFKEATGGIGLA